MLQPWSIVIFIYSSDFTEYVKNLNSTEQNIHVTYINVVYWYKRRHVVTWRYSGRREDTVGDLKDILVSKMYGKPYEEITYYPFWFELQNDEEMTDDRSLESCGVSHGFTLNCVLQGVSRGIPYKIWNIF